MEDMGGLKKYMPYTYWTMFIGLFGLSGFPLSNGFWSKDAIFYALEESHIPGHQILYFLAVFTASITAFYSTKLLLKIFHGEPRYDKDHVHPSPTGLRMRIPLVGLASLVVIESLWFGIGFIFQLDGWGNFEHELALALGGELQTPLKPDSSAFFTGAGISAIAVFAGIGLAYLIYGMGNDLNTKSFWTPFAKASKNRFGMDIALYWIAEVPVMKAGDAFASFDKDVIDDIVIDGVVTAGSWATASGTDRFDKEVVDGVVNGLGDFARELGAQFRQLQNGLAPWYARMMAASVTIFLLAFNLAFWTGNL
jgi:NADH-quinone oxidoreductase subunit L